MSIRAKQPNKPIPHGPGLVEQLQIQNREQGAIIDALDARLVDVEHDLTTLKSRVQQLEAQFPEGTF